MPEDDKQITEATAGFQASLDQQDAAQAREVDAVFRFFRTKIDDSVSPDFAAKKDALYDVYQALQDCQSDLDRGSTDLPDLNRIRQKIQHSRDRHKSSEPVAEPDDLEDMLLLMADQEPPFLYAYRELASSGEGLTVLSRFVAPTPGDVMFPHRTLQGSVSLSVSAIKVAAEGNALYGNWDTLIGRLRSSPQAVLETNLNFGVRLDGILRQLYRQRKQKSELGRSHQARVNRDVQRFVFAPLFHKLRQSKLVFVLNCREYREGGKEIYRALPDLVYLNKPERLRERLLGLCRVLLLQPFAPYVDENIAAQARASQDNQDVLLQHCQELMAPLGKRLQEHADVPHPLAGLAVEAVKLEEYVRVHARKDRLGAQLDELGTIVARVRKAANLYNLTGDRKEKVDPKYMKLFLERSIPSVAVCTVPIVEYGRGMDASLFRAVYALHRERTATGQAIETAVEFYRKTGDDLMLRVLEHMLELDVRPDEELKGFVAPGHLQMLRDSLYEVYATKLPLISRFLVRVFGRSLTPIQLRAAREQVRGAEERAFQGKRAGQAADQKKAATQAVRERARRNMGADVGTAPQQRSEVVARVVEFLASEWKLGRFPVRAEILRNESLGGKFMIESVLDLADQASADAAGIAVITVEGRDNLYASRKFLEANAAELRARFEAKVTDSLKLIQAATDDAARVAANRNRKVYSSIVAFLDRSGL